MQVTGDELSTSLAGDWFEMWGVRSWHKPREKNEKKETSRFSYIAIGKRGHLKMLNTLRSALIERSVNRCLNLRWCLPSAPVDPNRQHWPPRLGSSPSCWHRGLMTGSSNQTVEKHALVWQETKKIHWYTLDIQYDIASKSFRSKVVLKLFWIVWGPYIQGQSVSERSSGEFGVIFKQKETEPGKWAIHLLPTRCAKAPWEPHRTVETAQGAASGSLTCRSLDPWKSDSQVFQCLRCITSPLKLMMIKDALILSNPNRSFKWFSSLTKLMSVKDRFSPYFCWLHARSRKGEH